MSANNRQSITERLSVFMKEDNGKALKYGFWNAVTLLTIVAAIALITVIFFALQPVLKPLLWALLVASVLFPRKHNLVVGTSGWLAELKDSKSLLTVQMVAFPFKMICTSIDWIESMFLTNMKLLACLLIIIPAMGVPEKLVLLHKFYKTMQYMLSMPVYNFISKPVCLAIAAACFVVVKMCSNRLPKLPLRLISYFAWVLVYWTIIDLFGSFKFLAILAILAVLCRSFIFQRPHIDDSAEGSEQQDERRLRKANKSDQPFFAICKKIWRKSSVGEAVGSLVSSFKKSASADCEPKTSNRIIKATLLACIVVHVWHNTWVLCSTTYLLIPLLCLAKNIGHRFGLWQYMDGKKNTIIKLMSDSFNNNDMMPAHITSVGQSFIYLDELVVDWLHRNVNELVTLAVVSAFAILTLLVSAFAAMHIYSEGSHILKLSMGLFNQNWKVIENGQSNGTVNIATVIDQVDFNSTDATSVDFKAIAIQVYARLQQLIKDPSELWQSANSQGWLWVVRQQFDKIHSIIEPIMEQLKANSELLLSSTTSIISIVLEGGSTIIQFFLSAVVFLLTLSYLLSNKMYEKLLSNDLGTAMKEVISTMCMTSLKLGLFYGLWTWFIHTLLQADFAFIPAIFAALFGVMPFLPTYIAALPAFLDLWLLQSRGFDGVLLLLLQFAPTLVVKDKFHKEVKGGGGHSFITGLAVTGGVYCMGYPGAVIGPLLLCVVVVAIKFYFQSIE